MLEENGDITLAEITSPGLAASGGASALGSARCGGSLIVTGSTRKNKSGARDRAKERGPRTS